MSSTASDGLRRATIDRAVDALADQMVTLRRDIHAHPEVSHAEHRTTALVVETLERAGLSAKLLPVGTGAYCDVLPAGFDYTGADCSSWMRDVGFRETYVEHLVGPDSMVAGIK